MKNKKLKEILLKHNGGYIEAYLCPDCNSIIGEVQGELECKGCGNTWSNEETR